MNEKEKEQSFQEKIAQQIDEIKIELLSRAFAKSLVSYKEIPSEKIRRKLAIAAIETLNNLSSRL
jgi:hypothetical protein